MALHKFGAVTPSDSTPYAFPIHHVWVGGGGTLVVIPYGDTAVITLVGVPVGLLTLPFPIGQIKATGTTATNLVYLAA